MEIALITIGDENGKNEIIMQQAVRDNNIQIEELLIDLNIIDEFSEIKKEKLIELGLALVSHKGKINVLDEE